MFWYVDKTFDLEGQMIEEVKTTISSANNTLWYFIYGFSPYMVKYSLCNLDILWRRSGFR